MKRALFRDRILYEGFTLKIAGVKFWSSLVYCECPILFKARSIEVGDGGMQSEPENVFAIF